MKILFKTASYLLTLSLGIIIGDLGTLVKSNSTLDILSIFIQDAVIVAVGALIVSTFVFVIFNMIRNLKK